MFIIKKQKGFALITTILIFILISFVIIATVLLIDTSDQNLVNTNKQLQARELCVAGLDILEASMEKDPTQFSDILTIATSNPGYYYEVSLPYQMYPLHTTGLPDLQNIKPVVKIKITEAPAPATNKLLATATTSYGLTDTSVTLEILYTGTPTPTKFQKGRFLN